MKEILIAEIEPEIAESLKTILSEPDFKLVSTSDGDSALKIIEADSPSLVILDTELHGLDGMNLLRRLRTKRGTLNIPAIVVTSRVDNQPFEEARELRANDYFVKPVESGRLIAGIRKILKVPMAA